MAHTRITGTNVHLETHYRRMDEIDDDSMPAGQRTYLDPLWADRTGSDESPPHPTYREYNGDCSWCWLGYGHTQNAHAERVDPTMDLFDSPIEIED